MKNKIVVSCSNLMWSSVIEVSKNNMFDAEIFRHFFNDNAKVDNAIIMILDCKRELKVICH